MLDMVLHITTAYQISKIKNISEFNIGHFIVAESVFIGLRKTIQNFKKINGN